jgi:hypothetical protein
MLGSLTPFRPKATTAPALLKPRRRHPRASCATCSAAWTLTSPCLVRPPACFQPGKLVAPLLRRLPVLPRELASGLPQIAAAPCCGGVTAPLAPLPPAPSPSRPEPGDGRRAGGCAAAHGSLWWVPAAGGGSPAEALAAATWPFGKGRCHASVLCCSSAPLMAVVMRWQHLRAMPLLSRLGPVCRDCRGRRCAVRRQRGAGGHPAALLPRRAPQPAQAEAQGAGPRLLC